MPEPYVIPPEAFRSGEPAERFRDAAPRLGIDTLIAGVESRLESPDDADEHRSLVEELRRSVAEFETSHPRTTAILNEIMVTLGNMGI